MNDVPSMSLLDAGSCGHVTGGFGGLVFVIQNAGRIHVQVVDATRRHTFCLGTLADGGGRKWAEFNAAMIDRYDGANPYSSQWTTVCQPHLLLGH